MTRELDALPDAVLTLAIPGNEEEAQALQALLPLLLADALSDFGSARGDPTPYVYKRYPHLSAKEREKKIQEVSRRLAAARALHAVVQRLTVECL